MGKIAMDRGLRVSPRRPPSPLSSATLLATLLVTIVALKVRFGDDGFEFAPAVPVSSSANDAPVRPPTGPRFVDRAPEYGLDVVTRHGSPDKPSVLHAIGSGLALFDADGDGDLDLFVASGSAVEAGKVVSTGGPWLFRNNGPGRWEEITRPSGLRHTGWAQAVATADYDGDGDLDLYLAQHGPDTLWQNQGDGTFEDVTAQAGLGSDTSWGVGAAWGDVDGDGWLDLYVVNYLEVDAIHPPPLHEHWSGLWVFSGPGMLPGQPDRLWRNRGDGTFEDITEASGLNRPDGKGMAVVLADLDGDGLQDLYVTNDAQPNALFRNLDGRTFRDEAAEAGVAINPLGLPEGSMGVELGDLDADGDLDLVYSSFRMEGTRVCLNVDGRFYQDASNASRVGMESLRYVGWGLAIADFDADGWPDLFQANGHVYPNVPDSDYDQPPLLLQNLGQAVFQEVTAAWGPSLEACRSGRGVATGDLDSDGDLDIVMSTMDGPLRVLINEGPPVHSSAIVRLVGRPPNTEAIGARVELQAGGHTQLGIVRRGGGFLSASDSALHFGLGTAPAIDRITVRWPDGRTTEYLGLSADATLILRQDDDDATEIPFTVKGPRRLKFPTQ